MSCFVVNIQWERSLLSIELLSTQKVKLFLRQRDILIPLKQQASKHASPNKSKSQLHEELTSVATINMTTVTNRSFLENGLWDLVYLEEKSSSRPFRSLTNKK